MVGLIAATLPSDRRPLRIENENEEKKVKGEKEKTQELAAHAQVVGSLWRSSCVGWRGDRMRRRGKIDHWERGGALLVEKFEREGPPSVARRVGATERGMREEWKDKGERERATIEPRPALPTFPLLSTRGNAFPTKMGARHTTFQMFWRRRNFEHLVPQEVEENTWRASRDTSFLLRRARERALFRVRSGKMSCGHPRSGQGEEEEKEKKNDCCPSTNHLFLPACFYLSNDDDDDSILFVKGGEYLERSFTISKEETSLHYGTSSTRQSAAPKSNAEEAYAQRHPVLVRLNALTKRK